MASGHPREKVLHRKIMAKPSQSEDEVRFFREGKGWLSLQIGKEVLGELSEADDRISALSSSKYWFDMGHQPQFYAMRCFHKREGWVAQLTSDGLAEQFPLLD